MTGTGQGSDPDPDSDRTLTGQGPQGDQKGWTPTGEAGGGP